MSGKSFFDDESLPSRPLLLESDPLDLEDGGPLIVDKVMVKGGKFGQSSIVQASLFPCVLVLHEVGSQSAAGKLIGHIDLDLIRIRYSIADTSNYKYCLSFHRLGFTFELYFKDLNAKEAWLQQLAHYCILGEFEHRYEVIELLGKGSMGEVYKIKNQQTGELLAAKAFGIKSLSKTYKMLLVNEIRIMRRLSHPNILKMYEVHETMDTIFVVMDLMQHGDLSVFIANSQLSERVIRKIMFQLVQGLAYLESHGIIHRDIKPTNIMVTFKPGSECPDLIIGDFGLACMKDENIPCKGSGTHGYMPPEVVISKTQEGIQYTSKVDVFSAGVIFYKMMAKKDPIPFKPGETATVNEILKRYQISFNSRLIREFDRVGTELLKVMLALDPKDRISASKALSHAYFASEC